MTEARLELLAKTVWWGGFLALVAIIVAISFGVSEIIIYFARIGYPSNPLEMMFAAFPGLLGASMLTIMSRSRFGYIAASIAGVYGFVIAFCAYQMGQYIHEPRPLWILAIYGMTMILVLYPLYLHEGARFFEKRKARRQKVVA